MNARRHLLLFVGALGLMLIASEPLLAQRGGRGFGGAGRGFVGGNPRPFGNVNHFNWGSGLGWTGRFGPAMGYYPPGWRGGTLYAAPGGIYSTNQWPFYPGYYPWWGGYNYPYYSYGSNTTYNYDPGSYLKGYADLVNAQGSFMVKQQEAKKAQEEAKQAAIETRRKNFDLGLYEKANTPTPAQVQETNIRQRFHLALTNPSYDDIVQGTTLNDLVAGLKDPSVAVATGTGEQIPVDPALLAELNVSHADTRLDAGMLKDVKDLEWPELIRGPQQKALEANLIKAVDQAKKNQVDPKLVEEITKQLEGIDDMLDDMVAKGDLSINQFVPVKTFLSNLRRGVVVLRRPNAADYFNGTIAPKGRTVGELVDYMKAQKLIFTKAMDEDQVEAYLALYQMLARYAAGTAQENDSPFRIKLPNVATK